MGNICVFTWFFWVRTQNFEDWLAEASFAKRNKAKLGVNAFCHAEGLRSNGNKVDVKQRTIVFTDEADGCLGQILVLPGRSSKEVRVLFVQVGIGECFGGMAVLSNYCR